MTWNTNLTKTLPRPRTNPELKWLLNERAAITGEVARANETLTGLRLQLQAAQSRLKILAAQIGTLEGSRDIDLNSMAALDLVLANQYPTVEPSALRAVQAWAGKYGKRGALKMFVLDATRAAAPLPVTAPAIAQAAAPALRIPLKTPEERQALRRRVTEILTRARDAGQVELLGGRQASQGGPGQWLWRTDSFAQLVADPRLAGHEQPPTHTLGAEVGG